MQFWYWLQYGPKVSANLGFGFGIGPKPKQWFRLYTNVYNVHAGRNVKGIGNVDPGKSALVILDNDYSKNNNNRGLYGTISWQISNNKNTKGTPTRLVLGFAVPYE